MNRKKPQDKNFKPSYGGLSTLGERLSEKNPDVLKKFAAIKGPDRSFERQLQVLADLLPYAWKDSEAFKEAVKLGLNREYEDAIALLREVLRFDPDGYPAFHLMGCFHNGLGDFKQEVECYRKAIKIRPDYPQAYYDLGIAYWLLGNERKAFAAFKRAAPLAPEFAVADYWLTFRFDRLATGDRAENKKKDTAQRDRVMAQAFYMIGNAFVEFRMHTAARHAFKKAERTRQDFAEAFYQLGELHIKKLRNPGRAAKYLGQAEQLFVRQNELQKASLAHQLYCRWDEIKDKEAAGADWLKEGLRLHKAGRHQAAIDAYTLAIQFKPKYLEALYNKGIAYGCLADERDAAALMGNLDGADAGEEEDDPVASESLPAGKRGDSGDSEIEKAIWAFKDALRVKPDYVHAHIGLGASYIKSGHPEEAVAALQEAAGLRPPHYAVFYYLGVANRMLGRSENAVEALKTAAALKPDSAQLHFYLGLAYADLGQFQPACDSLQEAARLKPDFAAAHLVLGDLFNGKLGDVEKAVQHLKRAEKLYLKLDDQKQAAQVRQMLELLPQ
ncbi:MAG: tetratricopeptide repeat protein [Nitrospinae bacterium]|nr:tetratricopeptide repeat protein [Nitrospinota bacterium]